MELGCALYQRAAQTATASQMNQAALSRSVAAAGLWWHQRCALI
ncbi:MAG: hypothetical protein RSB86_09970 [Comamonas sp.]|nr:hypothetical protein [uncultured Comamonas sp.]